VSVNDGHYLVVRINDQFYVAEARCHHFGGKLAEGKLEGTVVTCPLHGSQFDLKDGKTIRWTEWTGLIQKIGKVFKSPSPLKTYQALPDTDNILIRV
jgi:3-phenylpropionate/trans-cinnamate dioxygenase ferredoxin subunit